MSPTTWPSASSTTLQVPSLTLPRHRTWTLATLHSASCSLRHTEDKPITAIQKACQSVSRHCLSCSIEQGNLREKETSINQLVVVSAHSKFSENTEAEKEVDRSGKPEERNSSNAQIRILLEEQRQMIIAAYCEKVGHHEIQAAHAEEERRILREELWRQQMDFIVKFINKVLQRWRNYENSKVLHSIRSQDESSSKTRTLFWNYQVEYKNYKMK